MEISVCSSFFPALISIFVSLEFLTPILVPESGFLDKLKASDKQELFSFPNVNYIAESNGKTIKLTFDTMDIEKLN